MPNVDRARAEILRIREYPVLQADTIETGMILVKVSNTAKLASTQTDATGGNAAARLVVVQDKVADIFIGVSMSAKQSTTEAGRVRVIADGIIEMPCTALAAAVNVGDKIGIDANDVAATATATPDRVIPVAGGSTDYIGLATKAAAVGATSITFQIVSQDVMLPRAAD